MKKVIIIGGGICGLTTAIALRRADLDVVVFERIEQLREVGAGLTLWANGVYALKNLGLADRVIAEGEQVSTFEFKNVDGRSLGQIDVRNVERKMGVPSISIHRKNLMTALEGMLEDIPVRVNHDFVSYSQNGEGVTAVFGNGHQETGDALLACDGFHSRIRSTILRSDIARYSGYTCWRGVAKIPTSYTARGYICHFVGPGAQVGIFDVGHNSVAWYATANSQQGLKESAAERKANVLSRFEKWPSVVTDIFEATENDAYLKNDIYDRDPVAKWIDNRVLLMGDAAHPTTPNLGQGACQAIEDASVLSDCLKRKESFAEAFSRFARLRQKRTAKIVLSSRRSGEISQMDNPIWLPMRDLVFEAIVRTGALKEFEQSVCYKV